MKKTLLIALLLVPFLGVSQATKPIDGFLGIKFGSNKAAVLAAMKAKGAVLGKNDADNLSFSNVKLGHRTVAFFLVKFVNNKAFEADFVFEPEVEAKILVEYNDLVTDVSKTYGTGKGTYKYMSPYKEGDDDGDIIVGLSNGKIDYNTVWIDAAKNSVTVEITTDMTVNLTYQNDKLTDEAIAKRDAKEKSQF